MNATHEHVADPDPIYQPDRFSQWRHESASFEPHLANPDGAAICWLIGHWYTTCVTCVVDGLPTSRLIELRP